MTMTTVQTLITVLALALGTALTRALPPLLFPVAVFGDTPQPGRHRTVAAKTAHGLHRPTKGLLGQVLCLMRVAAQRHAPGIYLPVIPGVQL